jgi:transcriptional regulator with XRE-family HTH domain
MASKKARARMGSRIRELREAADMKPSALARALGLTQPSIRNWETGKTSPSLERLPKIAEVLDADLGELYSLFGVRRAA